MEIKCFDVADIVISEASKKFVRNITENQKLLDEFKECCNIIDGICKWDNGGFLDIVVNEQTLEIEIRFPRNYLVSSYNDNSVKRLIKRATAIKYPSSEVDGINTVAVILPGVWY